MAAGTGMPTVIPTVQRGSRECRAGPGQAGGSWANFGLLELRSGLEQLQSGLQLLALLLSRGRGLAHTGCENEAHCKKLHLSNSALTPSLVPGVWWQKIIPRCEIAAKQWGGSLRASAFQQDLLGELSSQCCTTWGQNESTPLCPWMCASLTISVLEQAALVFK